MNIVVVKPVETMSWKTEQSKDRVLTATYLCGKCDKLNLHGETFRQKVDDIRAVLVGSQCGWCSEVNIFKKRDGRFKQYKRT